MKRIQEHLLGASLVLISLHDALGVTIGKSTIGIIDMALLAAGICLLTGINAKILAKKNAETAFAATLTFLAISSILNSAEILTRSIYYAATSMGLIILVMTSLRDKNENPDTG